MENTLHAISLLVLFPTWIGLFRVSRRWVWTCGVHEPAACWALAGVAPTSLLLLAVHIPGLVALATGWGVVTPASSAVVYLLLAWLMMRLVKGKRYGFRPGKTGDAAEAEQAPGQSRWLRWPLLVIVGMYFVFFLDAITRYPTGYDGLHYHLPVAVGWMHAQSLDLYVGLPHQSMPENGMIVPFLLAFLKLERLMTIVHLPIALGLALISYALARVLGGGRWAATITTCIVLSIPIVVFQAFSGYIDLFGATFFLAALLAVIWSTKTTAATGGGDLLVMAGLAGGIALGTKTNYVLFVGLLALLVMIIPRVQRTVAQPGRLRSSLRQAWVFGLALLVCSGFWFIRATVRTGNPIYPLQVTVAGHEVLPGFSLDAYYPDRPLTTRLSRMWDYPWREHKDSGYNFGVNNGLGAAFATFVPIGVLVLLIRLIRTARRRSGDQQYFWQAVAVGFVVLGGVLLLVVFRENPRFVLPFFLLAVPLGILGLEPALMARPRAAAVLLTASLLVSASISTLRPAKFALGRMRDSAWDRATHYEVPPFVDALPAGTRVLNLATPNLTYGLLGSNLANDVLIGHWQVLLGDAPIGGEALWDNHIDYIYTREPFPQDWPEDLPVELVFDDTTLRRFPTSTATRVYRVVPRDDWMGRIAARSSVHQELD